MVECQVRYIVRCLKTMIRQGAQTIEVRGSAVDEFDRTLQEHLREKVWNGYVTNWYKTADGHIVNNWCRSTVAYWWQTRRPDDRAFQFSEQGAKVAEVADKLG
jgi:hypothetical protein